LQFPEAGLDEIDDADPRTFLDVTVDDCPADAGSATRDQCNLSIEPAHVSPSPPVRTGC
jgi:hypothetical protein